jgi:hypothetical protein
MFHQLSIFSSLFTKVALAVILFGIATTVALRRSKRIEMQMRRLGELLNFEFFRDSQNEDGFAQLRLVGLMKGYSVEVINMPTSVRSARQHVVIVRAYCNSSTDSNFYLRKQSQLKEFFAPATNGERILSGDEMFDSTFTLHGNDENLAMRVFDNSLRSEFCNNADSFSDTYIHYPGDRIEFREIGRIVNSAHTERLVEMVPFIVDMVAKIDGIVKRNR